MQTFKGQSSYSALRVQCMWGMSIPCQVLCSIRVDWWLKAHTSVYRKWCLVPCMWNVARVSRWLTGTWCNLESEKSSDFPWRSRHLSLPEICLLNSLLQLTTSKYQSSTSQALWEGNPLVSCGFPLRWVSKFRKCFHVITSLLKLGKILPVFIYFIS